MIVIDVRVPVIGKTFDFSLEEDIEAKICIEEVAELICQREGCILESETSEFILTNLKNGLILKESKTLKENGIRSGDTLILT